MRNILVVSALRSYMTIAIEENFRNIGYNVFYEGMDITAISEINADWAAILLYADVELLDNPQALVYIKDKAIECDVPVFAIGDSNEINGIEAILPEHMIQKKFGRPIDVKNIITEVHEYVCLHERYCKKRYL